MSHNTFCSAMSKAKNFMPKENSKTQQLKKQKEILNPKTKIVCSSCGESNSTLWKIVKKGKIKYLCTNCKQKGEKKSEKN